MKSIRLLFCLFGENLPDTELEWFFSMGVNNNIAVIYLSTQPSEELYGLMKTCKIVLQGYRRHGQPYIDRRFIELYTVLRQFFTCLGQGMSSQLSYNEMIEDCLKLLEVNPPDAIIDKYYQAANTTLYQGLPGIPKLQAYIIGRNDQGSYNNGMYEAWSVHYERELVTGVSNNVFDDGGDNNDTAAKPEPKVPLDPSAFRYTRSVEKLNADPYSHHPSNN
jgi:hypothetical protein